MTHRRLLTEKLKEALASVLPITAVVALLCVFLVPMNCGLMLSFLLGALMIVVGMGLFTIGADISMSKIGNHIGARMTKTKSLPLILGLSLVLGIAITMAEPDLQVLAGNTPNINMAVLIVTVSLGVGFFLVISMLRIFFGFKLKWVLIAFYALVFIMAFLSDRDFLAVSFDAGGVTTGPMTVPFIIALGVGVSSIRSDENAKSDSFGLVALCSIGPVLAVLLLGFIYNGSSDVSQSVIIPSFDDTVSLGLGYLLEFPTYLKDVALALLPIFLFFIIFQMVSLKLNRNQFDRILVGVIYTYVGLVLFLTGVNVGFSPLGYALGTALVSHELKWLLIPLAMLMGWFIINAEPAVHVLNKQVEELSAGAISEKTMGYTLSIAVSCAMGLAMLRVLTGLDIMWVIGPGYLIAIVLSLIVPPTYTAIAFDAGGVASGPLTATFMLPFAMGACNELGGSIMTDAFGLVAMVAMMPLITVQVMGVIASHKDVKAPLGFTEELGKDEVIELWEVG